MAERGTRGNPFLRWDASDEAYVGDLKRSEGRRVGRTTVAFSFDELRLREKARRKDLGLEGGRDGV